MRFNKISLKRTQFECNFPIRADGEKTLCEETQFLKEIMKDHN